MELPSLADIGDVAGQITSALGFGSATPVKLGTFAFADTEVPEQIHFGSRQLHTIHTRPGGDRQIDVLGPEPSNISWSGIFLGPGADTRAQSLKALVDLGDAITLTWGELSFAVVVESLELDYRRSYHVPYSLSCITLHAVQKKQKPGLLASLTSDLGKALGVDINGTLNGVNSALKQVTPLLSAVSTLTGGNPLARKILGAVNGAQGVVGGLSSVANGNIFGLAQIATTFTSNAKLIGGLGLLGAAVNDAPQLLEVGNTLGRMGKNLINPTTG